MDFEAKLKRLEEIVHKMEKGELSLEDSMKFFEEGVKLSRECQVRLGEAEAKVKQLVGFDQDGNPRTTSFSAEGN